MILVFKGVCVCTCVSVCVLCKIAPKQTPTTSIGLQPKKHLILPTLEETWAVVDGQISNVAPFYGAFEDHFILCADIGSYPLGMMQLHCNVN